MHWNLATQQSKSYLCVYQSFVSLTASPGFLTKSPPRVDGLPGGLVHLFIYLLFYMLECQELPSKYSIVALVFVQLTQQP